MDIVDYLKPKFVLMENVVDILKFAGGYLGRYALGRLIGMNYQTRMGMMSAGSYGLPQFRMRVFMWGARFEEVNKCFGILLLFDCYIYILIVYFNDSICRLCLNTHYLLMMLLLEVLLLLSLR